MPGVGLAQDNKEHTACQPEQRHEYAELRLGKSEGLIKEQGHLCSGQSHADKYWNHGDSCQDSEFRQQRVGLVN